MKVRLEINLTRQQIAFLKEEAARRSKPTPSGFQSTWTWREVAWVKAQMAIQDWIQEQRFEQNQQPEAIA